MDQNQKSKPKKEYHTPKFSEYGDVQELTESSGFAGTMADGGMVVYLNLKTK